MLKAAGILPDKARALAIMYEYNFLLVHAAAYDGDRGDNPKLGAGVLVYRITNGMQPRKLRSDERGPGTFHYDWDYPEEIECDE